MPLALQDASPLEALSRPESLLCAKDRQMKPQSHGSDRCGGGLPVILLCHLLLRFTVWGPLATSGLDTTMRQHLARDREPIDAQAYSGSLTPESVTGRLCCVRLQAGNRSPWRLTDLSRRLVYDRTRGDGARREQRFSWPADTICNGYKGGRADAARWTWASEGQTGSRRSICAWRHRCKTDASTDARGLAWARTASGRRCGKGGRNETNNKIINDNKGNARLAGRHRHHDSPELVHMPYLRRSE